MSYQNGSYLKIRKSGVHKIINIHLKKEKKR